MLRSHRGDARDEHAGHIKGEQADPKVSNDLVHLIDQCRAPLIVRDDHQQQGGGRQEREDRPANGGLTTLRWSGCENPLLSPLHIGGSAIGSLGQPTPDSVCCRVMGNCRHYPFEERWSKLISMKTGHPLVQKGGSCFEW